MAIAPAQADIFRGAKSRVTDEEWRTVYNYIVAKAYRRDTSSVSSKPLKIMGFDDPPSPTGEGFKLDRSLGLYE